MASLVGSDQAGEINKRSDANHAGSRESQQITSAPNANNTTNIATDKEKQEGDKPHRWAVKFACEAKLADIALVFFTMCLVIATLWLGWATIGLWNSTNQSLQLASSEYASTHRPRITVRRIRIEEPQIGSPLVVRYRIVNSGETAAGILKRNGTIVVANFVEDLSAVPEYDEGMNITNVPSPFDRLHSGQWIEATTTTTWTINNTTKQSLDLDDIVVALIGYVRYSDDAGIVREMAFGRRRSKGRFIRIDSAEYEYQD